MNAKLTSLAALLTAVATPALAAPIVYTVNQSIGAVGSVTGTVTTDGTQGALTAANVTGWNLLVTGNGASDTLTNGNSGFFSTGSDFSATASGLFFDYSGASGSYILFQRSFGSGQNYWCNAATSGVCYQGASAVPTSYDSPQAQFEGRQGSQQIASVTAVPEPATWGLMLAGFGVVGATMRRRRPMPATA